MQGSQSSGEELETAACAPMQEPRRWNTAGTVTLVAALILFPFVLYCLLRFVVFGQLFIGITEGFFASLAVCGLYFSVFFTLSVIFFRNPHRLTAAFAFGMLLWVTGFVYVAFQAIASI
jgi:hypothetical protein